MDPKGILQKYWGYRDFRPLQQDIISSVLDGHDTLALMPTGGGKSICFQVPGLATEGITIVVSPLIALMKDQVEQLKKRGISAIAITSALSKREIDIALENAVFGKTKFLYLSPERLCTEIVRERLKQMKVNLLAVDEAHCISQWGYDFRPPYLQIAQVRELLPGIPILALTASATPKVVTDIQQKLSFKNPSVFRKSFSRPNLSYIVVYEENKIGRLENICRKISGTGIVYVRNRRKTQEVSDYLNRMGYSADFYHAGLSAEERDKKQQAWIHNQKRIIVSTNAFGMGIDKPDVRFVVHLDIPDNLEAYLQEAGRAGRDENEAWCISLFNKSDQLETERNFELAFPEPETISRVYNALCNKLEVPYGSGKGSEFAVDISALSKTYNIPAITIYHCLKFLEKDGLLSFNEGVFMPSRIMMALRKDDLYQFQVSNPEWDSFIKLLLRSYGGLFDGFIKIREEEIASRAGVPLEEVKKKLRKLDLLGAIHYGESSDQPRVLFLEDRIASKVITISPENYAVRKKTALEKLNASTGYFTQFHRCRSLYLLDYFGESGAAECGSCDVCRAVKQAAPASVDLKEKVLGAVMSNTVYVHELLASFSDYPEQSVLQSLRSLLEEDKIVYDKGYRLEVKS